MRKIECAFRLLTCEESEILRNNVMGKYSSAQSSFLWEKIIDCVSIQDQNAWMLIEEFLFNSSFIMFFDKGVDETMIELNPSTQLTKILEDCPGFVFYITNIDYTYLLCFNDHDFLIGAGSASKWDIFQN